VTKDEANFLRHGVAKLLALHRDGLTPEVALTEIALFIDSHDEKPINMIIFCPNPLCNSQHIDRVTEDWSNPAHRSHKCEFCGCIFRFADTATNGVAKIETIGKNDNWSIDGDRRI